MSTQPPRDKAACQKLYSKLSRQFKPQYPYQLRLFLDHVLPSVAEEYNSRTTPLETLATEQWPKFLAYDASSRNNSYYSSDRAYQLPNASSSTTKVMKDDLTKLFNQYQKKSEGYQEDPDILFDDGLEAFFTTVLGVEKNNYGRARIVFHYCIQSAEVGDFSRDEIVNGLLVYKVHQAAQIKEWFKAVYQNLTSSKFWFRDLYVYSFKLANRNIDRGTLAVSSAIRFWELWLPSFGQFETFVDWKAWLVERSERQFDLVHGGSRADAAAKSKMAWLVTGDTKEDSEITLDLWINFYDFAITMQDDYIHKYDFTGKDAWNTAFDQFVMDFLDLEYVDTTV